MLPAPKMLLVKNALSKNIYSMLPAEFIRGHVYHGLCHRRRRTTQVCIRVDVGCWQAARIHIVCASLAMSIHNEQMVMVYVCMCVYGSLGSLGWHWQYKDDEPITIRWWCRHVGAVADTYALLTPAHPLRTQLLSRYHQAAQGSHACQAKIMAVAAMKRSWCEQPLSCDMTAYLLTGSYGCLLPFQHPYMFSSHFQDTFITLSSHFQHPYMFCLLPCQHPYMFSSPQQCHP
jgi:hypothetical protein